MEHLTNFNENTISSVLLVKAINAYREKEGNRAVLSHSDFLKKIENELDGDEGKFSSTYLDGANRQSKCYELPKDEATLMLMSESRTVRRGVLNELNLLKRPRTHLEVLQSEMALLIEKERVSNLLIEANNKIEEDKPKVVFADSVIGSSNSVLVRQFAKDLCDGGFEIGQNRLFEWFRDNKYLNKDNEPYQNHVASGLFEVITRTIGSGTETFTTRTTKITGKGQVYFAEKIKK